MLMFIKMVVFYVEYTKRNQDHIEKENYQNLSLIRMG